MYRRQHSGFDRVPFVQRCDLDAEGVRSRAMLCNLSILGAYVHCEKPPSPNSLVTISFRLPDEGATVFAAGSVTWVNGTPAGSPVALPTGFGLRFSSVAPDDLRRIAALVATFLDAPQPQLQVGVGMPPSGKVRIPFVAPCVFVGETRETSGSVCNLSALGIFAALDQLPRDGERGRVRFPVPGLGGDFETVAVVAWRNLDHPRRMRALPAGCGFRFEGLSLLDQAVLNTVVDDYLGSMEAERRSASSI